MKKWLPKIGFVGLLLLLIGFFLFGLFMWWNPDCDGFSCIGFFVILAPFFLVGLSLLLIFIFVFCSTAIWSYIVKEKDE
jgi:hypothetical protein